MIILWGLPADDPLAAVCRALERLGHRATLIDQRHVLDMSVEMTVDGHVDGRVRLGVLELDLAAVTAIYLRPHDTRRLAAMVRAGEGSAAWWRSLRSEDILLSWTDLTRALVINRPSAMAGNNAKPFQALQIRRQGFAIPETLVTTDRDAALDFWERHGTVVYKSISGVRSIVARLSPEHASRLDDLAWCPTQFQRYIAGRDYRVHVVGAEVFACEIRSTADDYRYASRQGLAVALRSASLPVECADRCRNLARALDLPVAGIDRRLSTDGTWYCFEVNPSPGFTYYEAATGQPIATAIARLLAGGNSSP